MKQFGLLDFDTRLQCIDKSCEPMTRINGTIDWEKVRPILQQSSSKEKKLN